MNYTIVPIIEGCFKNENKNLITNLTFGNKLGKGKYNKTFSSKKFNFEFDLN